MSAQVPTLGRIVWVTTPSAINGQKEHAAIITQVWNDDMINAYVMPGSGSPMVMGSIYQEGHPSAGDTRWRWPPHVPPSKPSKG